MILFSELQKKVLRCEKFVNYYCEKTESIFVTKKEKIRADFHFRISFLF